MDLEAFLADTVPSSSNKIALFVFGKSAPPPLMVEAGFLKPYDNVDLYIFNAERFGAFDAHFNLTPPLIAVFDRQAQIDIEFTANKERIANVLNKLCDQRGEGIVSGATTIKSNSSLHNTVTNSPPRVNVAL